MVALGPLPGVASRRSGRDPVRHAIVVLLVVLPLLALARLQDCQSRGLELSQDLAVFGDPLGRSLASPFPMLQHALRLAVVGADRAKARIARVQPTDCLCVLREPASQHLDRMVHLCPIEPCHRRPAGSRPAAAALEA